MEQEKKEDNYINRIIIGSITIGIIVIVAVLGMAFTDKNKKNIEKIEPPITESTAIEYLLNDTTQSFAVFVDGKGNYIHYTYFKQLLEGEIKRKLGLQNMKSYEIATKDVITKKDNSSSNEYYLVTLYGNCTGYTDVYNTDFKQEKFTIKVKVYQNGKWEYLYY